MFQLILANKFVKSALPVISKYWQILAGAFAIIAAFIFKRNYDSKIKKETTQKIESVTREETAKHQKLLDDASLAVTISHASNPLPSDWAKLEQLSKKATPTAKQKVAAERVRKKLRPKD